jgi:hypothetical protein
MSAMEPLQGEELHVALLRASVALSAAYELAKLPVTISSAVGCRDEYVGSLRARHRKPCAADWTMLIFSNGRVHASNVAGASAEFPDLRTALEITMMSIVLAAGG